MKTDHGVTVTGMVLKVMPIGEYDKRITLLTMERGKITAFARGAKRPSSQLLAATNPFCFGTFELFEGRSYSVSKAAVQNYFRELARDVEAGYCGFYFLEFADYCCQENADEREMLRLLYQSLRALLAPSLPNRLVRVIFELKAMSIEGQAPGVFSCIGCGAREGMAAFSVRRGGMLCGKCASQDADVFAVDASTIYAMQFIVSSSIEKLYTFAVNDEVLLTLERIMGAYLKHYWNHEFQSLRVLNELDGLQ